MRAALAEDPQATRQVLDCVLCEAHVQAQELVQLKTRSSPQRLASYLVGLIGESDETPARFVLPYEKRLLAARIGCSQENLSRAFASLRQIGAHTRGAGVVVGDMAALRSLAEAPRSSHPAATVDC
jgi:CRP/FNR family transcriptional activator FtrB